MLIIGGLLLPMLPVRLRGFTILALPLVTLLLIWQVPDGAALRMPFLGYELTLVKGDALSRLFATVFAVVAFAGGLFALNQSRVVELAAAFCYAGGAIGVVFAGDLISLFVFWELMAIASTLVVWSAGPSARGAGLRYAAIHLLGGVLLMAGIAGEVASTGSLALGRLELDSLSRGLILAGFLINAGAWPLSSWLPDAYPESSWSGMVFLSAFTTKAAVYVLLRCFPGTELLIYVGLFMVFYGIVYAILENDMRRILAYSIVSQVGFMVTGIGIGTELALNGVAAHAFAHIVYKALLLMSAGSVLYMTGKRKCTDLGGLFRTMPLTTVCGIVGALSISSFPLTSGFVSKSMISEAAGVAAARGGVVLAGRRLGRHVPVRRHQVSLVRLLSEGFGPAAGRSALEHARRDGAVRGALHRHRRPARATLRHLALSGRLRSLYREPCGVLSAAAAVLRPRIFPDARLAEADADDHARR